MWNSYRSRSSCEKEDGNSHIVFHPVFFFFIFLPIASISEQTISLFLLAGLTKISEWVFPTASDIIKTYIFFGLMDKNRQQYIW